MSLSPLAECGVWCVRLSGGGTEGVQVNLSNDPSPGYNIEQVSNRRTVRLRLHARLRAKIHACVYVHAWLVRACELVRNGICFRHFVGVRTRTQYAYADWRV